MGFAKGVLGLSGVLFVWVGLVFLIDFGRGSLVVGRMIRPILLINVIK
ncbi:MAG: hypothetical protein ACI8V2_003991 [Candidatus Latescibacterota bacterium]|jgi:hypothetical protein